MTKPEIKEFYKKTFNTVAEGYDHPALRFFPEGAARLPGYLHLKGDEQVLDVATGTGAAALALALALPGGKVTGIDFSEKMLARAGAKLAAAGVSNVELHEMDMQHIAFPDNSFDAAICSFALFFVEDMAEQLRHVASKVKLGGRVCFTSFSEDSFSPPVGLFFSCLERNGIKPPIMSWKRVASTGQCRELLIEAGLADVNAYQVDSGYQLHNPEEWWHIVWNGGFRGLVQQMDEETRHRFRAEHLAELGVLAGGQGIRMEMGIIYAIGTVSRE